MNNVAVGGLDTIRGRPFSYYETIGGGAGAAEGRHGASSLHTHMTNTLNTPVEGLEAYYPLKVVAYGRRWRSGGRGRFRGGDGIVREIEFLVPSHATILSERRRRGPYGLAGGSPGRPGRNLLFTGRRWRSLPAKTSLAVEPGTRLRLETPGGGGWGRPANPRRRRNR
jgi:N-methylhydantoinase B